MNNLILKTMIIDWKKIAIKLYDEIKDKVSKLEKKPTLWAVLIWDNSSSLRYIWQKKKWAEYTWINFDFRHLEKNISEEDLLNLIKEFNKSDDISWYIIQLPLPEHINTKKIISSISPKKDVDWFCPENIGKISIWDDSWIAPCTPAWIMYILKSLNIDLKWKNVCVIGRSNIVWKPITMLLMNAHATVTNCNSKTKDLKSFTKTSDIIICAAGKPGLLKADMIKDDTIIIDVWFTVIDGKIYWDADTQNINQKGNMITPVPWWVWPLTVSMLMKNTLDAHNK